MGKRTAKVAAWLLVGWAVIYHDVFALVLDYPGQYYGALEEGVVLSEGAFYAKHPLQDAENASSLFDELATDPSERSKANPALDAFFRAAHDPSLQNAPCMLPFLVTLKNVEELCPQPEEVLKHPQYLVKPGSEGRALVWRIHALRCAYDFYLARSIIHAERGEVDLLRTRLLGMRALSRYSELTSIVGGLERMEMDETTNKFILRIFQAQPGSNALSKMLMEYEKLADGFKITSDGPCIAGSHSKPSTEVHLKALAAGTNKQNLNP